MPGKINPVGGNQQRSYGNTPGQGFRGQPESAHLFNYGVGIYPGMERPGSLMPSMPTLEKQWAGNNFINPLNQAAQRPSSGTGMAPKESQPFYNPNVPNIPKQYQPSIPYAPTPPNQGQPYKSGNSIYR